MINKKLFIEIINKIKQQDKIDEAFSKSLETVCDSWCMYGFKNLKYGALFDLLKEIFNDKGDWISYFIYETDYGEKKMLITDNKKKIYLRTPEDLYNFLIKNIKNKR